LKSHLFIFVTVEGGQRFESFPKEILLDVAIEYTFMSLVAALSPSPQRLGLVKPDIRCQRWPNSTPFTPRRTGSWSLVSTKGLRLQNYETKKSTEEVNGVVMLLFSQKGSLAISYKLAAEP
jgi:hypothetical protein